MDNQQAMEILGTQFSDLQREAITTILVTMEAGTINNLVAEQNETWLRYHQGAIAFLRQFRGMVEGAPKAAKAIRERRETAVT